MDTDKPQQQFSENYSEVTVSSSAADSELNLPAFHSLLQVWFQNRRAKQRKQDRITHKVLPVGRVPGRGPLFSSMCVSSSAMGRQYQCPHSLPHIPRFSSVLPPGGFPSHTSSSNHFSCPSGPAPSQATRQPDDWYNQLRNIGSSTTSVLSLASVSALETTSHWN
ncbi:hypothetical protein DPX16_12744 [Anabarilius grahami]|uniref:Homeobox domain-containing protein n=1 Tax=Anabarilius grahami TaxID=495550 RepID=A0A3N0XS65_ANAGA|nr:hypothetical protein DPX16_12744 [Anabarilius grahami]